MSEKMKKRIQGASIWVIAFGIFVGFSLITQCIIPFLAKFCVERGIGGVLYALANQNFKLPMDVITSFWAAISAAYIGVDRAAMTISTINGEYEKTDYGNPGHNKQVIVLSFFIYTLAVILNLIFDVELSLIPLATSLGAAVLLYVSGQKAIYAASKIAPECTTGQDPDRDNSGINDEAEKILREFETSKTPYAIYSKKPGEEPVEVISITYDS
jgi:hypothetical protein